MSGRVECIRRRFENVEKASSTDAQISTPILENDSYSANSSSVIGVRRSPAFRGGVDAKKEAARTLIAQKLAKHVQAVNSGPTPYSNKTLAPKNILPAKKAPAPSQIKTNHQAVNNLAKKQSVAKRVNSIESTICSIPLSNTVTNCNGNGFKNAASSEIRMISKELIHKFENKELNEEKSSSQDEPDNFVNNIDSHNRPNPDGKESNFDSSSFENKLDNDSSTKLSNEESLESLTEFLNSPLPIGPPPRKPPRTFAHMSSVNDTKKKLEKLEVALKNRSKGRVILPRRETPNQFQPKKKQSLHKDQFINQEDENSQNIENIQDETNTCFECLGGNSIKCNIHVYDGIPHGQSEFFVPTKWQAEHIYAEPFKISPISIPTEPGQLHYMSTPVENVKRLENTNPSIDSSSPNSTIDPLFIKTSRLSRHNNSSNNIEDSSLDRAKIQLLMNQAFGAPLHEPQLNPAVLDEDFGDTDGTSTNNENTNETPFDETAICQLTLQRKKYVRHMSSQCNLAAATSAGSPSENLLRRASSSASRFRKNSIYEVILLIGLNFEKDQAKTKMPYLKTKFPTNAHVPYFIEHLVFPEASQWPLVAGCQLDQTYTVVITDESGARKYGYCRRVLPENGTTCLPLAYCLITPHKANGFYHKVLTELELRHGQSEQTKESFMSQLYKSEFPLPGNSISIVTSPPTDNDILSPFEFVIKRPIDTRMEDRDLSDLFNTLSVPVIIQLFSSLLLERKLILLSYSLSLLSSCIEGLQSLLYPFFWVHTVVPVVPEAMLELVHAPTPYLLGILKQFNSPEFEIDQGLIIDLDTGQILACVGDESSILPARIRRCLKSALQLVEAASIMEPAAHHVLVSEAFIRSWVELCGHFETHIVTQQDSRRVFERESFIKAAHSRSFQCFLEWFSETAMFSNFITSKIEQTEISGLFEQRILEHSEEMEKNTALFMKNYRVINKKVKTLSDRLKDWTSFS